MKIAVCVYGQPRSYKIGFNHMRALVNRHKTYSFEFFLHAWVSKDAMSHSPFRKFDESQMSTPDVDAIQNELVQMYGPLKYKFEQPLPRDIVCSYTNTKIYDDSSKVFQNNAYNVISQFQSRNRVRNMLRDHVNITNEEYDTVLMIRYDNVFHDNINFFNIDKTKVNIGLHKGRHLFMDNQILCPQDVFFKLFDFNDNFPKIANNTQLKDQIIKYRETYCFNAENILVLMYLLHYNSFDNVCDFNMGTIVMY